MLAECSAPQFYFGGRGPPSDGDAAGMDDSARGSHDTVIGAGPDTITLLNTTANDFGANDFLF